MEFSGEFELEGVSTEEAWLVLSDPVALRKAAPGCKYLTRVEDEGFNFDDYEPGEDPPTLPEADPEVVAERAFAAGEEYAALLQVGVGSVEPVFEARVTIDEREYPTMRASGHGTSSGSAVDGSASMTVSETEDGTLIEWTAETNISGRLAQMGQRVLNPVANKLVNQFFDDIEEQMQAVEEAEAAEEAEEGLVGRIREAIGR